MEVEFGPKIRLEMRFAQNLGCEIAFLYSLPSTHLPSGHAEKLSREYSGLSEKYKETASTMNATFEFRTKRSLKRSRRIN